MPKAHDKSQVQSAASLECKQCHREVSNEETVAYHLVDQILYGWCQSCFGHRQNGPLVPIPDLAS